MPCFKRNNCYNKITNYAPYNTHWLCFVFVPFLYCKIKIDFFLIFFGVVKKLMIAKSTMIKPVHMGGLNMVDINKAIKIMWIKR